MRHHLLADALARTMIGNAGSFAGFASKAARKRIQQEQVLPFTKALSAFVEKMTSSSVNPDPAACELNDKSLAKMMDFVNSLAKASNAYPPAMADNITFVIRDQKSGQARKVSALLRTTGGDCSQAVGKSMASLFAAAGTPSLFYWDAGMWQLSSKPADEATVQDARAKAAAAGVPSSDPMTLQELEAVQAKMAAKKAQASQPSGHLAQAPITDASFRDLPTMPNDAGDAELAHRDVLSNISRHEAAAKDAVTRLAAAENGATSSATAENVATSSAIANDDATNPGIERLKDADPTSRHKAAATDTDTSSATANIVATSSGVERLQGGEPLAGLATEGPEAHASLSPEEDAALKAQGIDLPALKAQVKKLAPLLAALAAVPWIDPTSEDGQRVPFIKSTVLDEVEGMGWDVRGGVTRLWAGERNFDKLLADKDPGSHIALQAVIDLTSKFERDFGKKTIQT